MKYTSAEPFTPKFVKDHLSRNTKCNTTTATGTSKKLPSFRAEALYEERVHRRQLGLARRIQSQKAKAEDKEKRKKKKNGVVAKREKMGRREAAEMGVWRLRREEARCVPAMAMAMTRFFFLIYLFLLVFFCRWDAFVPLHRLWLGYMSELLGLATVDTQDEEREPNAMKAKARMPLAAGMHAKLVKADFHGSIMTGSSSRLSRHHYFNVDVDVDVDV